VVYWNKLPEKERVLQKVKCPVLFGRKVFGQGAKTRVLPAAADELAVVA
jgi:hypothetical protein